MGWWGTGVMQGDEPMDIVSMLDSAINEMCGISDEYLDDLDDMYDSRSPEYDAQQNELQARISDVVLKPGNIDKIIDKVMAEVDEDGYDDNVAYQAIGAFLMAHGWPISSDLRSYIVDAATEDEWAQSDRERRAKMVAFRETVRAYDNKTPTTIESEGLLSTIFNAMEALDEGYVGLINVGPGIKQARKKRRQGKPWMN